MVAMIAPTTLTRPGPQQAFGGDSDYWAYSIEGYLVRYHRNKRKALFVPQPSCPVPLEQLANYRRTMIRRPVGNNEDFSEQYKTMEKNKQRRVLPGEACTGKTRFRVNKTKEKHKLAQQHKPPKCQHKPLLCYKSAATGNPATSNTTAETRTGTISCPTQLAHNQDACTTTTTLSSSSPFDYVTQGRLLIDIMALLEKSPHEDKTSCMCHSKSMMDWTLQS